MQELIISKDNAGGRLDKTIAKFLDRAPKGFVYKMLRKKNIELNGKKAKGNELLKEGDSIRFFLAEETIRNFQSSASAVPASEKVGALSPLIVYEDANLIAINKPTGLLSQKAKPGDVSLNELLVAYLKQEQEGSAEERLFTPGIANRLDRNTSGIVLAGKTPAASRELNAAIRERRLQKKYLCLVKGSVTEPQTIDGYLCKDEAKNEVKILPLAKEESSSRIVTAYAPLASGDSFTLLEVDLITGKSHQIRAHLASIGHPIAGDPKYGDRKVNAGLKEKYGLSAQLLHAARICFQKMEEPLAYLNGREIEAPLPEIFEKIINDTVSI